MSLRSRNGVRRIRRERISQYFKLGLGQDQLDFVDVDVRGDDPLFLDPRALRTLRTPWTAECVTLIQDFFDTVLQGIRTGDHPEARRLLRQLREPNETHLGLSRGRARGQALGPRSAKDVADALLGSEAIRTGLLADLEETVLMIEGIAFDRISDMATNIIRGPLIAYTQAQAAQHRIAMQTVGSGALWDPGDHAWYQDHVELPLGPAGRLLLVPKAIVRKKLDYSPDEYFQHYILDFLIDQEISTNGELVRLLKDKTPRVYKNDLVKKYGRGKAVAVAITKEHPEILDRYRRDKAKRGQPSLEHEEFARRMPGIAEPDWQGLLAAVRKVKAGGAGANEYHRAVQALLTPLFYPDLASPEREVRIHRGRKRIDITFANQADRGFFAWVRRHHPAMYQMIECKNFTGDPGNPELDQLAGRFSPSRGKVGLLFCRRFKDKDLFIARCRDTANDQRGFILPFDDEDLATLVAAREIDDRQAIFEFLKQRWDQLVL